MVLLFLHKGYILISLTSFIKEFLHILPTVVTEKQRDDCSFPFLFFI